MRDRALHADEAAAAAGAVFRAGARGAPVFRIHALRTRNDQLLASSQAARASPSCCMAASRGGGGAAAARRSSRQQPPAADGRSIVTAHRRCRRASRGWPCPTCWRCRPIAKRRKPRKTIGEVLWDDLNFEREFYMIPRDTYKSIPAGADHRHRARSIAGASSAPTAW